MAQNRTRKKAINIRMTQEEYDRFQEKLDQSKARNQTEFLLALIEEKPIVVIEDLTETLVELKKQGIMLNQAMRKVEGEVEKEEIQQVIRNCNKVYRQLLEVKLQCRY